MWKSCTRCGKVHSSAYKCSYGRATGRGLEDKLRSQRKWTNKSLEIREASQNLCAVCRAEGTYTYGGLEVHHIVKVKDSPEKLLDNENLICLCTKHHKEADEGKLDADYLRELARAREYGDIPPTS